MKYKAVCFDIDGTLYPASFMNRNIGFMSFMHPVLALRYKKTRAKIREIQDCGDAFFDCMTFNEKEAFAYCEVTGNKTDIKDAREYLDRTYYKYLSRIYSRLPYQEETVKTFEYIKSKGLLIGIFSDWPLYSKLERIGVKDLCDATGCSVTDGYLKPSVHAFEKLLYNLKIDGSDVLYVGDSYSKDIEGAVKAGMDGVLIGEDPDRACNFPKACAVVENWKEFDLWLRRAFREE